MILVTGAKGQLGGCIVKYLKDKSIPFEGVDRDEFDITNKEKTFEYILQKKPSSIIHCSAYSNVDKAEEESDLCMKTNVTGTENIALACKEIDAKLLFISTDYVFDGTKKTPYDPDDAVNPLSIYGMSKAMGESIIKRILSKYFIVRTSWLFGKSNSNFVETIIRMGKQKSEINVVNDQIGSPTYTEDLVPLLIDILKSEKYGVYHITNEGFCSWAEFAREIIKMADINCKIIPISSEEYHSKAIRPKNSRMNKDKLILNGFGKLPSWQDALRRFLEDREK